MSTRLDVRNRAVGIARSIGAPVEPMVYLASFPASASVRQIEVHIPIERGPYVAFDGYFDESNQLGFTEPIALWSGNRPLVWLGTRAQWPTVVLPAGGRIFPAVRGVNARGASDLDGWPAPAYIGAGEDFIVRRLNKFDADSNRTIAFAGFHTSRVAQQAIAREMGEVRFWTVGQKFYDLEDPYPAEQCELSAPEDVEIVNVYNEITGWDQRAESDHRDIYIENKFLARSRDTSVITDREVMLGVPSTSSPASVIGPRPLRVGAPVSEYVYSGSSDFRAPLRVTFVGRTTRVDF